MDTRLLSVPPGSREAVLRALSPIQILESRTERERFLLRLDAAVARRAADALLCARIPFAVGPVLAHSWFPSLSLHRFGAVTMLVLEDPGEVPVRARYLAAGQGAPPQRVCMMDYQPFEAVSASILADAVFERRLRCTSLGVFVYEGEAHVLQEEEDRIPA